MEKIRLRLIPLIDPKRFSALRSNADLQDKNLRHFLSQFPAVSLDELDPTWLDINLKHFSIQVMDRDFHLPPQIDFIGTDFAGQAKADRDQEPTTPGEPSGADDEIPEDVEDVIAGANHPSAIEEREAVLLAYGAEIEEVASYLRAGLSVLIQCDKRIVMEYLWKKIAGRAGRPYLEARTPPPEQAESSSPFGGGSMRQQQLANLMANIRNLAKGSILMIPHLDLLAGGQDSNLTTETRELIEVIYESSDRILLAFIDRSLLIPEVLMSRFDRKLAITGVPREVIGENNECVPIGRALVTQDEADRFEGYEAEQLYKNVAGMNPVQLRHAIQYAMMKHEHAETATMNDLRMAIRAFKVETSSNFEVPNIKFEHIGGYEEVKTEMKRAIALMMGGFANLDDELRKELIPRGFIFYGPPGTGKTLFAKAIAHELNATIQVVSGPEVMDMYVGESERKLRELFAEARRNAPSVLVFDEFDSLATKREGRSDGGARAGNAVVAQMLTEMDGFRTDVPMLVIGTTNRIDMLDEALLRPSRFTAIPIDLPDPIARRAIAEIHARKYRMSGANPDFVEALPALLDVIAEHTDGFSGDEIQSLFRQACLEHFCLRGKLDAIEFGRFVGKMRLSKERRARDDRNPGGGHPGQHNTFGRNTSYMMPFAGSSRTSSNDETNEHNSN